MKITHGEFSFEGLKIAGEREREIVCRHLNRFLMRRFGLRTEPVWGTPFTDTLTCMRAAVDLYLRVIITGEHRWPDRTIVLARIGFRRQRVGHGTATVKVLRDVGRRLGFNYLGIECPNTASTAFGLKLGFRPYDSSNLLGSIADVPPSGRRRLRFSPERKASR